MLVYILLLGFICFDFWLEHYLTKKGTLSKETKFSKFLNFVFKYRVLTIFALVFISTFRAVGVGGDTHNYYEFYKELRVTSEDFSGFDIGYASLNYLLSAILNLDFRCLYFIISLFVTVCFVVFVKKLSCNHLMSMFLYITLGVFTQGLSALRQIIAIGFILISLIFIIDKKIWKSILFIAIATLFHSSAILCLIIVPLRYIKLNHWVLLGATIIVCSAAFLMPYVLKLVESIIPSFDYYTRYYIEHPEFFQKTSLFNILYTLAMIAIYTVLYLARFKWFKNELEEDKSFTFFLTLFTLIPLVRIAGLIVGLEALLNRINMYFFYLLIILIPRFLQCLKKYNHSGWLYGLAYAGAFAYMVFNLVLHDACAVVPYIFWF